MMSLGERRMDLPRDHRSRRVCWIGPANSMHIMTEALGMALPGTTPVRAGSDRMFENARQAARRVMDFIADDIRPRDISTPLLPHFETP